MDVDITNSVTLTLTATSGVDFVHIGNNENPHCVYNSDCIVDLIQHSFNAFGLYPRDKLHRRSLTARNNDNNASKSLMSQRLSPNLPLSHSITPTTRSLSSSVAASNAKIYSEMTTFVAQPPGSPPGLTASKSSKSSSFHSYLSGTEAKFFDSTNFEEIYIDEGNPSQYRDLHNNDNKRPPLRKTSIAMNGGMGNDHATKNQRELTNGSQRPPYPHLQTKLRITAGPPTHSPNLPRGKSSKRGFTSPSAPSLAMTAMSNLSRSRSPSPSQTPNPGLLYPASPYCSPRPQSLSPEMNKPPVRRGSWQPSKKSVKELEDEYDDLDEDLPEEASLWNVPLSPRPCHERAPTSAANSTNVSPRTSPERSSPLCSSANNNINVAKPQSPKPLPIISPKKASSNKFLPKLPPSPSKLRYSRGVSTGDIPDNFYLPKHRSKTWDVALSELSEEAKFLTEALESHAEASERQQEQTAQSGTSSITPSVNKIPRAKTCSVELPPLRISNVMIDPLPASKEKEKVLSRTRPSWLPPKDRKEERKHLKEYQRMMTQSVEAEKRKAVKAANAQCVQDDTKNALLRIWEEHVLPNWDQVIREPRTRELWWRGVAPRSRAQVWEKAIGNDLALTEVTYTKALQRAKDMEIRIAQASPEERFEESVWFEAIRRDIKVVFPELKIFQPGGPLHDGLVDVLMAYSMYRSDVGYSHGTHLIAGLLSLTLPTPTRTFLVLANLLNRPLPHAFLTGEPASIQKAYALTLSLLSTKLPRLHTHLFSPPSPNAADHGGGLGLSAHEVLEPMMRTLFLAPAQGLSVETTSRVWDVMMLDGDALVVRTAVAVLAALESRLYGSRGEVLRVLGWGGSQGLDVEGAEEFMVRVRSAGKKEGRLKKG